MVLPDPGGTCHFGASFRAAQPFIVRFFSGLVRPSATVLGNEFGGLTSFKASDGVFGYDGSLATMPEGLTFDEAAPGNEGGATPSP